MQVKTKLKQTFVRNLSFLRPYRIRMLWCGCCQLSVQVVLNFPTFLCVSHHFSEQGNCSFATNSVCVLLVTALIDGLVFY